MRLVKARLGNGGRRALRPDLAQAVPGCPARTARFVNHVIALKKFTRFHKLVHILHSISSSQFSQHKGSKPLGDRPVPAHRSGLQRGGGLDG